MPALEQKAKTLSDIIEKTRVLLSVSPTVPNGTPLEDDILLAQMDEADCVQRLEEARVLLEAGDHVSANKMAEQVSSSMSSTLLTKCADRILICHSNQIPYYSRVNCLERAIKTLQETLVQGGRNEEHVRVLNLALLLQARLLTGDLVQKQKSIFLI